MLKIGKYDVEIIGPFHIVVQPGNIVLIGTVIDSIVKIEDVPENLLTLYLGIVFVNDVLGCLVGNTLHEKTDYNQYPNLIMEYMSNIPNQLISCAESCTGGALINSFIKVEGASKFVDRSFITYSNNSKRDLLGVNPETIEQFGVTSLCVVKEMTEGVRRLTKSQLCLATSGFTTNPDPNHISGTLFLGILLGDHSATYCLAASGKTRSEIIENQVKIALEKTFSEVISLSI